MAAVHNAFGNRQSQSQHVPQLTVPVMEPHYLQSRMSRSQKLQLVKDNTGGYKTISPSNNPTVSALDNKGSSSHLAQDSYKASVTGNSAENFNDTCNKRQRRKSDTAPRGDLHQSLIGLGKSSSIESSTESRLGSSGSWKSDSSRPLDGFSRLDSSGRPDSSGYISGASAVSTPDRPSSALARGVKITEYKENKVNPEPIVLEDTDLLLEDHLSTRKLKALTSQDNLENVHVLELKVDTTETSLGNFGSHLPNLTQLKLSNSIITSVRDLGSSLHNIKVLWMSRCGLEDLDGLSSINSLRELYLSYNEIYDISPCSMLEHLKILDLEGNNIDELSQIEFLALCNSISHLTLEGNPVCTTPSPDMAAPDYDYRQAVKKIIPHLQYLDDEPLVAGESRKSGSVFDEDWKLIEELLEEGNMIPTDDNQDPDIPICRPGTAIRPTTGYRPGSALKQQITHPLTRGGRPGTGFGRLSTSHGRPASARPTTARPGSSGGRPSSVGDNSEDTNDSSDLTLLGGVVCGNPSKALRSRQRIKPDSPGPQEDHKNKLLAEVKDKNMGIEYNASTLEEDPQLKGLISEIKAWKEEHQKTRDQIEAERAPQVLKIDHDDAVSLSGDEESLDSDSDDELFSGYHSSRSHQLQEPPTDFGSSWQYTSPGSSTLASSNRPRRLLHDESFEARDEGAAPVVSAESSPNSSNIDLKRHSQGFDRSSEHPTSPLYRRDGPRLDSRPPVQLRPLEKVNPTLRSPESPGSQKPTLSSRMRKTNVSLLPSKPVQFK